MFDREVYCVVVLDPARFSLTVRGMRRIEEKRDVAAGESEKVLDEVRRSALRGRLGIVKKDWDVEGKVSGKPKDVEKRPMDESRYLQGGQSDRL